MLYLPDPSYHERFLEATLALPPKLLPYLYGRGLGIFILPASQLAALMFMYDQLKEDLVELSFGRDQLSTAHYNPQTRRILMPTRVFYDDNSNVLLHEIGHAVDHLYLDNLWLNEIPQVRAALRPNEPLNPYCHVQDEAVGMPVEQFATSFEALFTCERQRNNHEVYELSDEFVELAKELLFERFQNVEQG